MRSVFLLVLLLYTALSHGQIWFDIGLKGGGGTGFLNNKTISSDPRLSLNPGYLYFYGGKIGLNYGYHLSLATDIGYGKNSFSFNQAELLGSSTTFRYLISYESVHVTPLLRYTNDASYVEIGPEFQFVAESLISDAATAYDDINPEALSRSLTSLVFGFGGYVVGNDVVALQMGLRFHYSLSNLTASEYETTRFPLGNYPDVDAGVPTHPFAISLHFEINYSLGQLARSSSKCGRRVTFLTF